MTNRLAGETSPYLLQHADNPVDWYPWGPEALERARSEDRPILLSIGYAACHWCHVMEHESFEDEGTAALMNALFVNVKVDREERPDLDSVYMDAVVTLTGQGGWPMTVFLTPEGEPFHGGTYYPPEPRHGLPSFRQVLAAVAEAYRERRPDVARSATALVDAIQRSSELAPSQEPLTDSLLSQAARDLRSQFDPVCGGFGRAPKFPPASTLEFLLRRHRRSGDDEMLAMVRTTLDAMAAGGMYDLLGGGFHRYSVDERWLVPHFEKMLYDNALLAPAYLHAWVVTGTERYRTIAEETLGYMLRELRLAEGCFASAQDADTDGVEGLTFTWTPEELAEVLGRDRPELLEPFEHGRSILRGDLEPAERHALLETRERRPKPLRDDKAITSWNGLALAALAESGRRLQRLDLVEAAQALAEFLLGALSDAEGRLYRTYRLGQAKNTGYLEDYADVANGLYELHLATGSLRWLQECRRLALLAVELFADEERGGFFLSPAHGERLVARKKAFDDHPTPSGNSMLASVLLRLARIYGDDELERRGVGVLRLVREGLSRAPSAFGHALCALDLHLSPPREIAVVGPRGDSRTGALARGALAPFDPNAVAAFSTGQSDAGAQDVPLLAGKDLVHGQPAVYICERFQCRAPVTRPENLARLSRPPDKSRVACTGPETGSN
ncbi:MAG: thioredoxin domain-containing protein [Actinobacteria bacterium]|nr:thioredoxin domain-containing protein [Actinomycetota bacterium]